MKKLLGKFVHWLVLDCKKATYYIDKQEYTQLCFWRRVQLKLHLWLCGPCQVYASQSHSLSEIIHKADEYMVEHKVFKLCDETKRRFIESLKDELKKKR